jgi:hypothetical protein
MGVQIFVHIANVLFLTSYLVRDIFLLRILTLVAGFTLLPFYFFVVNGPMTDQIFWSLIFSGVNIFQLIHLYNERKPIVLTRFEQEIYQKGFQNFTLKQFSKLIKAAKEMRIEAGGYIVEKNSSPEHISLLLEGSLNEEKKEESTRSGQLIGAVNFITRTPSSITIEAAEACNLLCWDRDNLNQLFDKDKELKSSWQTMMTERLAERLATKD